MNGNKQKKRMLVVSSGGYFKNGTIKTTISDGKLEMLYELDNLIVRMFRDISYNTGQEIDTEMRNFIVDIYYEFERDGSCMNLNKLSNLLGMSECGVFKVINHIKSKMKKLDEAYNVLKIS